MSSPDNKTLQSLDAIIIYDPQVVDDRVDFLNSVFKHEQWQDFIEKEKKKPLHYKGRDPKVKGLELFRQKSSEK